jgi:hypothetical protein
MGQSISLAGHALIKRAAGCGTAVDVGIAGVHFKGEFIELVPWNASMSWEVEPWGSWKVGCFRLMREVSGSLFGGL